MITPPQPPMAWAHSADDIIQLTIEAIGKHRSALNKIAAVDSFDANFKTVFLPFVDAETEYTDTTVPLQFYQKVSSSQDIRDASSKADSLARDYDIEYSMRPDVYDAIISAKKNIIDYGVWDTLTPEEQRLVDKMVQDGKRNGLALPENLRVKVSELKKELSQACLEFDKNMVEEHGSIIFTTEELKGIPEQTISGFTKRKVTEDQNAYEITFQGPDISSIFSFTENPDVRKRSREAYDSRLAVNVPVLHNILHLRRKIADLLGYATWADYVTEVNMAKSAQAVINFLDDLEERFKPSGTNEIETDLLPLKKKECEAKGLPFDGKFNLWDSPYYGRLSVEGKHQLDSTMIKEHFPVASVVPKILDIYEELLSVTFKEVKDSFVWHPDVTLYAVWEKEPQEQTDFLGYCYLDLYPRPGKHSHNSMFSLKRGYTLPGSDDKRVYPVCAMVANLAKSTPEAPALMTHFATTQFFHEMGHALHELLSVTRFARFHGPNAIVAVDFAEAPAMMLENWCWEPRVLQRLSSHYETGQPLPTDVIDRLVKSRYADVGRFYLWQIFLAKYDITIHTNQAAEPQDYTKLWSSLQNEITLLEHDKETPGQAAFGHLVGYDSAYYGYSYSLVFASDMYMTIFKTDPFDPIRGKRYREKILRPGASRDEIECLKDFLGRPPNANAFMEMLSRTQSSSLSSQ